MHQRVSRGELFRKAGLGKTTRLPSVPDRDILFIGPVEKKNLAEITGLDVKSITDADLMAAHENAKVNEALNELGNRIGAKAYEDAKAKLTSQKRMAGIVLAALAGGAGTNEIIEYLQGPTIEETEYYR